MNERSRNAREVGGGSVRRRAVMLTMVLIAITGSVGYLVARQIRAQATDEHITLFCGAGLRPAMAPIIEAFHQQSAWRVRAHYGASNLLLGQLTVAPDIADAFLPGDAYYVEQARLAGLVGHRETVAWFVPVIMVQAGNPKGIRRVVDLATPGTRLALADARSAAIGRIMPRLLANHDMALDQLAPNIVFTAATAHELATAVSLGHADATIVWESVARGYEGDVLPIPERVNVITPVEIGIVIGTPRQAGVEAFIAFVISAPAREILR